MPAAQPPLQMTVAEATAIADTALEHAVRCVLQAVHAQEILKSSRGALMWHGRDLRHYKRLLSPPLQQLLTCPGTAVLGRGLATLPASVAHDMGAAQVGGGEGGGPRCAAVPLVSCAGRRRRPPPSLLPAPMVECC